MVQRPMLTDYVAVIMQLFEQFMQHRIEKQGVTQTKPLTYSTPSFTFSKSTGMPFHQTLLGVWHDYK